jgi:hypothetical protein
MKPAGQRAPLAARVADNAPEAHEPEEAGKRRPRAATVRGGLATAGWNASTKVHDALCYEEHLCLEQEPLCQRFERSLQASPLWRRKQPVDKENKAANHSKFEHVQSKLAAPMFTKRREGLHGGTGLNLA